MVIINPGLTCENTNTHSKVIQNLYANCFREEFNLFSTLYRNIKRLIFTLCLSS